jgi:hypothetical protein
VSKRTLASALACLLTAFGSLSIADDECGKGGLKDQNDGKTWTKSGSVTGPKVNVTAEAGSTINARPGEGTLETSASTTGPADSVVGIFLEAAVAGVAANRV